jgi:hypothetical protein
MQFLLQGLVRSGCAGAGVGAGELGQSLPAGAYGCLYRPAAASGEEAQAATPCPMPTPCDKNYHSLAVLSRIDRHKRHVKKVFPPLRFMHGQSVNYLGTS